MARKTAPLSTRLKRLRAAAGYARIPDLARACGVPCTTLYEAESGRGKRMSARVAQLVAPKLGIPWPELCE